MTSTSQPRAARASRPQRIVAITGMHRSGTSLMARAINLLGLDLGSSEALMEPGDDNPAGYWENLAIKELDDELLTDLGGSWDEPPALSPGWENDPALDVFRTRATEILDSYYAGIDGPVGFKEPRLCVLLPFWRSVVTIPTTVVVVRHPAEVAASLSRRNNIAQPHAAVLWLRHILGALHEDPDALVVRHRDLNTDLEATLARFADHLDLAPPTAEAIESVRSHIDPALDHYDRAAEDTGADHPLMILAREVWNGGDINPGAVGEPLAWNLRTGWLAPPAQRQALAAARGQVVALRDTLRKRNRAARAADARADRAAGNDPDRRARPAAPAEKAATATTASGTPPRGTTPR